MKKMKSMVLAGLVCSSLVINAQAMTVTDNHPVFDDIRVMEYSLNSSSVTNHLSSEMQQQAANHLHKARMHAEAGYYRSAEELVARVGGVIYRMNQSGEPVSGYSAESEWLQDQIEVYDSMIPVAYEIAREKQIDTSALIAIETLFRSGLEALSRGELLAGYEMVETAYTDLQQVLIKMRSGDLLMVSLPEPGTLEAWQDAERSYHDWVYTTNRLVEMAPVTGEEQLKIQNVLSQVEQQYKEAGRHAESQQWQLAVSTLDDAFERMEDSWRVLGIEI